MLIPGLSAGTLAFIMGIYEKLILTISNLVSSAFQKTLTHNKMFLFCLFFGCGLAILTLPEGLSYLLKYHSLPLYAVFTGMIVASLPSLFQQTDQNKNTIFWITVTTLVCFTLLFMFNISPHVSNTSAMLFIVSGFLGGFFSVLPGVSGSTVLLLLGSYPIILQHLTIIKKTYWSLFMDSHPGVVSDFNLKIWINMGWFLLGCLLGLTCVFYCMNICLQKYKSKTFSIILGLIIGSLPKVFPWQILITDMSIPAFFTVGGCFFLGVLIFVLIDKTPYFFTNTIKNK